MTDNTQTGSDTNVTTKHSLTEVEADAMADQWGKPSNNNTITKQGDAK